ncbi:hypothetical protein SAMN05216174_10411 [Actinokineospora iranica]|uniref:Uncharacterized protein n=1 Tax=Actinokineospora iranica TaxID=1271860 RepID=A0A1G6NY02_9PSEU|nr:hypothetical protein SAMN05216174_10411 [Actinokineospora iranica]
MIDEQFPDVIFDDSEPPIPEDVSDFAAAEDEDPQAHMSDQEVR